MMNKFVIKHNPSNKFANLTFRGLDALNIGWNPKIYDSYRLAELDLAKINQAIDHNREVLDRTETGTQYMVKTASKQAQFMEKVIKGREELAKISADQFIIEEYDENKIGY